MGRTDFYDNKQTKEGKTMEPAKVTIGFKAKTSKSGTAYWKGAVKKEKLLAKLAECDEWVNFAVFRSAPDKVAEYGTVFYAVVDGDLKKPETPVVAEEAEEDVPF